MNREIRIEKTIWRRAGSSIKGRSTINFILHIFLWRCLHGDVYFLFLQHRNQKKSLKWQSHWNNIIYVTICVRITLRFIFKAVKMTKVHITMMMLFQLEKNIVTLSRIFIIGTTYYILYFVRFNTLTSCLIVLVKSAPVETPMQKNQCS